MPSTSRLAKKEEYDEKLCHLLDTYDKLFIVHADNVGSKQFQDIRRGLRDVGDSIVLMGKNTMMKRSIRLYCERTGNETWSNLLDSLVGNVGLIFTKADLAELRDEVAKYKVGAPARVGLVAPNDVIVPGGNTGLDPSQTSFFQALNIPTKINKGCVEIVSDVHLIKASEKVGGSEATLLAKLGIKPFSYGLVIQQVFESGALYDPKVLDIKDDDIMGTVTAAIARVAAASLELNYPTLASIPHSVINGYKNVLAVSVATDYDFPLAEKVKAFLADPSAFVVESAPEAGGGSGGGGGGAAEEKKEEAKAEEEEEEEDDDMGFSLFD
ncbi:ribosomal protein P0 (A0) (L10E) [Coccomyxa viridis]|uniref:60S acidic ribosomal protein P0 n=1 Tax=Coccomyxa viridis TaxID=1274662 RepID=A0AAV1HVC7_9CHLO|nr:ribosomal protein P0 (A0) (L10E) [Coccomyxa viridis]